MGTAPTRGTLNTYGGVLRYLGEALTSFDTDIYLLTDYIFIDLRCRSLSLPSWDSSRVLSH